MKFVQLTLVGTGAVASMFAVIADVLLPVALFASFAYAVTDTPFKSAPYK